MRDKCKCKYIITLLVIVSFLFQGVGWTCEGICIGQDKLAKDTAIDDPGFIDASNALAGALVDGKGVPVENNNNRDGTRYGGSVLRSIIAAILVPILVFMWLISPVNVNTSFAQTPPGISRQVDPQWLLNLNEVLRLEERNRDGLRYNGSIQYDSLRGAFISGGAVSPSSWGIIGNVGVGNPLISYSDEGFGGIGTAFLRIGDESWVSLRTGVLPDYTPDSTQFLLVGIDTRYHLLRPYLHAGVIRRELDDAYGNALGLLVDGGVRINWRGLDVDLRGSGPLYFRPVASTVGDYRRVMGDLSLLRARLRYNRHFWWFGGVAELGGLESRFDPSLPTNRFSRYSVDSGVKFDIGQIDLALALQGERINPSFAEGSANLVRPSLDLTWRDLSLRGGVWVGPFVRPYSEVMYRLLRYIDITVGYNSMPPIYHEGLFEGPFSPRNMVTFGIRGGTDTGTSTRRIPNDEYPVQAPTGTAMGSFAYGPLETPVERAEDELDRAMDRFERSLKEAVTGAKTSREVIGIFKRIGEQFDPASEEQFTAYYIVWSTFWDAFYKNPNIDFHWMRALRDSMQTGANVYQVWHENGHSYNDIVRRLLAIRYEVPDANSLHLLIAEFNQLMTTAGGSVDEGLLINLYEEYRSRLEGIEPGGAVFTWTYYVASRLFAVLVQRSIYPGVEKLVELIEANLKIPQDLARLNIGVVVPNDQIVGELLFNVPAWINADNPDTEIQGLLVLEYLLNEKGNTIIPNAVFVRLDMIILASLVPEPVPLVPEATPSAPIGVTKESVQFKRLKAAIIALDILIRINRVPDKDVLKNIMEMYEGLPADLKKELNIGVVSKMMQGEQRGEFRPGRRGPLQRYEGFIMPVLAGLILTGCSGSEGVISAMGILCALAAVTFAVGTDLVPKPVPKPTSTYKPTGDKIIDSFLDAVFKGDGKRKTILALDTDIGNIKDSAIPLLAVLERLSLNGQLGEIIFIRGEGARLADRIKDTVGKNKNASVVLVCKNTNRENFNDLQKVFITSIDDSNREGNDYIPILEILALSLKMARSADVSEVQELYKNITGNELTQVIYDTAVKGLSLLLRLPPVEPMDYEFLRNIYESQKELLLSA